MPFWVIKCGFRGFCTVSMQGFGGVLGCDCWLELVSGRTVILPFPVKKSLLFQYRLDTLSEDYRNWYYLKTRTISIGKKTNGFRLSNNYHYGMGQ